MNTAISSNGAPQKKTIYLVIDGMDLPHGTEMLAAMLGKGLVQRGYNVHLFAAHCDLRRTAWKSLLDEQRIEVHQPGFWFLTGRHAPHRVGAWLLCRAVKRHPPVLVASVDNCLVCCYSLQNWQGVSVPYFVHDPNEASPKCPNYVPLWFDVCNRVSGLSTHGLRQQASARSYYQMTRPVSVVYPGCFGPATAPPPRTPGETIHFGLFGRVHPQKGTLFAIGALRQVLQRGGKARLTIFGAGPMEADARELAASLGLEDHVAFHGRYEPAEFDALVSTVDVGLMPSIYEGFGIVMLELMARGRPVIATDVGSSQEVIGKLGGGVVVERADTGALADAMLEYCRNPQKIVTDGSRARHVWEENFTVDAMTERYLNFWRSCGADV